MRISGTSSGASQFASAPFPKIDTRKQRDTSEGDLTPAFSMADTARSTGSTIDATKVFMQFDCDVKVSVRESMPYDKSTLD